MARLVVQPASDGHNMRGNWEAKGRGKTTSHVKKSAAESECRKRASEGDTIVLKKTDGNFQESYTYSGSRNTNSMSWGDEYVPEQLDGSGWDAVDDEDLF